MLTNLQQFITLNGSYKCVIYSYLMDCDGDMVDTMWLGDNTISHETTNTPTFSASIYHQFISTGT